MHSCERARTAFELPNLLQEIRKTVQYEKDYFDILSEWICFQLQFLESVPNKSTSISQSRREQRSFREGRVQSLSWLQNKELRSLIASVQHAVKR